MQIYFQEGIVSCTGVSLDTDLLDTLTEGRVVMLLPGSDFTMEVRLACRIETPYLYFLTSS